MLITLGEDFSGTLLEFDFGVEPAGGDDRLDVILERDPGEVNPGLVTMFCFSTTILLLSLEDMNPIPFALLLLVPLLLNGTGTTLKCTLIYHIWFILSHLKQ